MVSNSARSFRWGHAGILAFWLSLAGALYGLFTLYLQPRPAVVNAQGELVIPRHRDGHFYVEGKVHGKPIRFLVDTGATRVAVSQAFAQAAGLPAGQPVTLNTANGSLSGTLVRGIEVSAGTFTVPSTSVTIGLVGMESDRGLLGQAFLAHFEVHMSRQQLVLRPSPASR